MKHLSAGGAGTVGTALVCPGVYSVCSRGNFQARGGDVMLMQVRQRPRLERTRRSRVSPGKEILRRPSLCGTRLVKAGLRVVITLFKTAKSKCKI